MAAIEALALNIADFVADMMAFVESIADIAEAITVIAAGTKAR